ncbi:MAG: PD-(D/E)XK nuclease family protein [Bacillota bacterium]|nr:PD-(D/E)XK nuclease family protein [Bacillota bacterium]MDW7677272.1 PD-(D/E)XK nuclease family protein [Bacillota bacterium]
MDPIIQALTRSVTDHRITEKILIAPTRSEGRRLAAAVVARGTPVLNLRVETLYSLLHLWNRDWLGREEKRLLPADTAWFLIKEIFSVMKQSDQLAYFNRMELSFGMISALKNTVSELRQSEVLSEMIRPDTFITPEKSADMKQILQAYEKALSVEKWADELLLFQQLDFHALPLDDRVRYLLLPHEAPAPLQRKLMEALLTHPGVSLLEDHEDELASTPAHFIQSSGQWNETRDTLRYLKETGTTFDEAVLLTSSSEPYVTYLHGLSHYYGIPMTFGGGLSITLTRPGGLFTLLLRWIRSNYRVNLFGEMLRSGLFRCPKGGLGPGELEQLLRDYRVGWGKERYATGFERALEELQEKRAASPEAGQISEKIERTEASRQALLPLLDSLPDPAGSVQPSPRRWMEGMIRLVDAAAVVQSELDGEAKKAILEQLHLAASYAFPAEALTESLQQLQKRLSGLRVGASSPKPGALHVDSLHNGRFTVRSCLMIAGLDARRFPGIPAEGPVLLDVERRQFPDLPLMRDLPALREKRLSRLLNTFPGRLVLTCASHDPLEHREESPSAALLQAYRKTAGDETAGYQDFRKTLSTGTGYLSMRPGQDLDTAERWLRQLYQDTVSGAANLLADRWSFIHQGRTAFKHRWEGTFNAYNGRISVHPADVDPRLNPELTVSASQLEQLAKCPYVHFLQRLLGLYPQEEAVFQPDAWLSAMERGSLLHAVYESFYREVGRTDAWQNRQGWRDILQRVLEDQLIRFRELVPPPGERIYQREASELADAAQFFLNLENEIHRHQRPAYLELKLGLKETHPILGDIPPVIFPLGEDTGFSFRGAVDRIDELGPCQYEVIDYKTGSTYGYSDNKPFDEGRRLQHALYARSVELILKERVHPDARVLTAGYLFPTPKGQGEKIMYANQPQPPGSDPLIRILTRLLDGVAAGTFLCWGGPFDRKQEDYQPIMDQNPPEEQMKILLETTDDPELLRLLEVKNNA